MVRAALLAAGSVATLLWATSLPASAEPNRTTDNVSTSRPASLKKAERTSEGHIVRVTVTRTVIKDGKAIQMVETVEDPSSIKQVLKGEKPV